MESAPVVFVVDDDNAIRSSLRRLIESVGLRTRTYASAQKFLEDFDEATPGCLVVDVRLRGMSGLDLQEHLQRRAAMIPIIVISGHGDVPMAVRALKAGAVDFFEKPVSPQDLLDCVRQAIELDQASRRKRLEQMTVQRRLDQLTERQRQVLDLIVAGCTTNQVARRLGLSPKTVYAHRAEALAKLRTGSVAEAARQLVAANAS